MNSSAMASILNDGMMVGVRLGSDASWHGNIIYGVSGNMIRIAYIEKFMKGHASPGCPIWVKYSNDYFIYYFTGTVFGVSTERPEYVLAKIETAEEIINHRLYPRYDVRLKATVRPVWDDEVYPCTVTDLSYGGAAFICTHQFDLNEYLEMSLSLPDGQSMVMNGKVVRRKSAQDHTTDHGIQFIECDNMNSKLLSEYFSQLEEEASLIYNYYVEEVKGKL